MSALGLDLDQKVILYDQSGMLSAARGMVDAALFWS